MNIFTKGKFEAEFHLLTQKEAEEEPAGLGREGPDELQPPVRPETSFLWFTRPMNTFRFIIWKHYSKQIILFIFILLIILIFTVLIVQLPSALMTSLIKGWIKFLLQHKKVTSVYYECVKYWFVIVSLDLFSVILMDLYFFRFVLNL